MKKSLAIMLIAILALFCIGCSSGATEEVDPDNYSELTLYANGGTFWMGEEDPYEADLSAATLEDGMVFAEAVGENIASIEKDGVESDSWTIYAVADGEWVTEEVTDLDDNQMCAPCGDYGYYLMSDYEILDDDATTAELLAYEEDGRDYYAIVNW